MIKYIQTTVYDIELGENVEFLDSPFRKVYFEDVNQTLYVSSYHHWYRKKNRTEVEPNVIYDFPLGFAVFHSFIHIDILVIDDDQNLLTIRKAEMFVQMKKLYKSGVKDWRDIFSTIIL